METKFPITTTQREAFLNFIMDYPLVIRTLQSEFPADQVCHRAMILADLVEQFLLPEPLVEIDRAILKASIEKSDWLNEYEGKSDAARARRPVQLRTLRECAEKLEPFGIEVVHIPR
jgi:hypothetical protein